MELTVDQQRVVTAKPEDQLLILAGPGTGKTEVVARRLAYLISQHRLRPSEILVLSFSRSAVRALVERIRKIVSEDNNEIDDLRHLSIRTFDSWSFRMLRIFGHDAHSLLSNSYDKNIELLTEELEKHSSKAILEDERLGLKSIRHLIVDECQDLTGSRANLVLTLLSKIAPLGKSRCGFTILGDPNQAIYDFTDRNTHANKSSVDLLDQVQHYYTPTRITLAKNHRASRQIDRIVQQASAVFGDKSITNNAEKLLSRIKHVIEKNSVETSDDGLIALIKKLDDNESLAVLCRDNGQALQAASLIRDASSATRLQIKAGTPPEIIPSWIAVLLHKFQGQELTRSVFRRIFDQVEKQEECSLPSNGNWESAWRMLMRAAHSSESDTAILMDDLRQRIAWPDSLPDDEGEMTPKIVVSTIHQSKGLEFDVVYLRPDNMHNETDHKVKSEEARVIYVGLTRARNRLGLLAKGEERWFTEKAFGNGRNRWYRCLPDKNFHRELEIGLQDDIDVCSIVDADLHGGSDKVKLVQDYLTQNQIIGKPVNLEFTTDNENGNIRVYYNILTEDNMLLGRTTSDLAGDLYKLKSKPKQQTFPKIISGLCINAVTTVVSPPSISVNIPEPWNTSRLWLAPVIHGIGSFKFGFRR